MIFIMLRMSKEDNFMHCAGTAWLSLRLDAIGLTVLTAAGLLAVASEIDPSVAGLSLIYALDLTKFLKFGTRIASKTETDFNSVERIAQYLEVRSTSQPVRPFSAPAHCNRVAVETCR